MADNAYIVLPWLKHFGRYAYVICNGDVLIIGFKQRPTAPTPMQIDLLVFGRE